MSPVSAANIGSSESSDAALSAASTAGGLHNRVGIGVHALLLRQRFLLGRAEDGAYHEQHLDVVGIAALRRGPGADIIPVGLHPFHPVGHRDDRVCGLGGELPAARRSARLDEDRTALG
jgi:hypothetical protein